MREPARDPSEHLTAKVEVTLTRGDLLLLLDALHVQLADIRQRRAHEPEALARANRNLGELIWRLEEADAPPGTVVGHSADAVPH